MHPEARKFLEAVIPCLRRPYRVLEIGSRNVNGSVRYLFPHTEYIGIDCVQGPGVDIVADGSTYQAAPFDCVISTETLEHAPDPLALCRNMMSLCKPGGWIVITAASPTRTPHGIDGADLNPGEPYQGVTPECLRQWLDGCSRILIDTETPEDIYAVVMR